MSKSPYHRAAFINAIAEEGDKEEAVRYLQETWNDLCEAAARIRTLEAENAALREARGGMSKHAYSSIYNQGFEAGKFAALEPAPVTVGEAARLTDGQLVARCADAWEQVPVGSKWQHRKGGVYVVKGVALTSDSLTPVVVYQKTTGHGPAFTRDASEFLDGRFRALADAGEAGNV